MDNIYPASLAYDQKRRIQVLIVEDDLRIAEINRRFIEKVEGFQVCGMAANEEEAKLQIELLLPDLVVLDVYFPDSDGIALLGWIKQHFPATDVIMLTAAKESDTVLRAVRSGAFDFLIKPLIFERLRLTLERYKVFFASARQWLEHNQEMAQTEIDRLMQGTQPPGMITGTANTVGPWLAKGIDRITCGKVLRLLEQKNTLTTNEAEIELGISRSTARRYLEYLVEQGVAQHDQLYGIVGRPERIYKRRSSHML